MAEVADRRDDCRITAAESPLYFYTRWFCCMNKSCRTTLVMPERYKVMNPVPF